MPLFYIQYEHAGLFDQQCAFCMKGMCLVCMVLKLYLWMMAFLPPRAFILNEKNVPRDVLCRYSIILTLCACIAHFKCPLVFFFSSANMEVSGAVGRCILMCMSEPLCWDVLLKEDDENALCTLIKVHDPALKDRVVWKLGQYIQSQVWLTDTWS